MEGASDGRYRYLQRDIARIGYLVFADKLLALRNNTLLPVATCHLQDADETVVRYRGRNVAFPELELEAILRSGADGLGCIEFNGALLRQGIPGTHNPLQDWTTSGFLQRFD